jgi:hypothetical protein
MPELLDLYVEPHRVMGLHWADTSFQEARSWAHKRIRSTETLKYIPTQTRKSCQLYLEKFWVWLTPCRFDPSRFLDPDTLPAWKSALATFGGGSRICIGIHLAYIENRHVTAAFFRDCRGARLAEGTNEESMRAIEYFGMEPHSLKCEITMQE